MPGGIVAVHRRSGEAVQAGDPLVTLEAMKMEHVVAAPVAGAVTELSARVGDQVRRGQRLAIVEPER
jgi:biotin carboxyl carrier protein